MNAGNKLKTTYLMGIDIHFAQIIITVGMGSEGSCGSEGSSYTDSPSRVVVGSL